MFLCLYKIFIEITGNFVDHLNIPITDLRNMDSDVAIIGLMIVTGIFAFLAIFSWLKYWLFKIDFQTPGHEFVNHLVKMASIQLFEDRFNTSVNISQSSQAIELENGETEFMREVVHNYSYRDSGLKENVPFIEWKIVIQTATPENSIMKIKEQNPSKRNKELVYYSTDMMHHLEIQLSSFYLIRIIIIKMRGLKKSYWNLQKQLNE